MLVRLFENNGQYLTHFMTKEHFSSPALHWDANQIELFHIKELKQQNNYLQYRINSRDATYAQKAELTLDSTLH
jgi:hypothetical protein